MKLVIYDDNWRIYQSLLKERLDSSWSIRAGSGNLAWLLEEIRGADALIALELPREARAAASELKLFLFPGAGVEWAKPDMLPEGCFLSNVYEHEIPIAEYVLTTILMCATEVLRYSSSFREGIWAGSGRLSGEIHEEICGKTLGLVGLGRIAQAVAVRAQSFGLRIEAIRLNLQKPMPAGFSAIQAVKGPEGISELFSRCDFIVIACDLNERTRGWIGVRELSRIRKGTLLVNVSRAEIIQEEALFRALQEGRFFAALDVWYRYPTSSDQRLSGSRFPFERLPNVLATPHLSAWTGPMLERRMRQIAENLRKLSCGEPLERVVMVGSASHAT